MMNARTDIATTITFLIAVFIFGDFGFQYRAHLSNADAPQPENVLTIKVYRRYTELLDNGELVVTVVECDDRTQVLSSNGHRCASDLDELELLVEGYVPLPIAYFRAALQ